MPALHQPVGHAVEVLPGFRIVRSQLQGFVEMTCGLVSEAHSESEKERHNIAKKIQNKSHKIILLSNLKQQQKKMRIIPEQVFTHAVQDNLISRK